MISQEMAGLLLCVDGNANLLINDIEHKFSRGSMCIVSPYIFVEIVSASDDCKWEAICDDKDVFLSLSIYVFDTIKRDALPNNSYRKLDEKQIEEFMFLVNKIKEKKRMLDSKSDKKDIILLRHNITMLEQIAEMDFITAYFQKQPPSPSPDKGNRDENVACNFINSLNQNYSVHRDVGWYAKQANLSPAYFTQVVHRHIGYTPIECIKNITIAKSKVLLAQPEIYIKEVAATLNFPDQSTFFKT
jgi:AraC-like DNA-binding protein